MSNNLSEVIYTPESQLRHPWQLLRSIWKNLLSSRELAWRLFVRNISAKYRQTMFGYAWAFLPPIFTTLTFVFLNSQKIFTIGKTDIPYPAYVLIGTVLWGVFVNSMNAPLRLINQSKSFLAKINFSREALILTGVEEVLFDFIIRSILLFVLFIWYRIPPPATILLAPLGIFSLIALGQMFGLLLVPLGVLYQDIGSGLGLITSMWLFLTPVVYPPPTSWPASLLSTLNPVSPLLVTTREMITMGSFSQMTSFWVIIGFSVIFLFIGLVLYHLAFPHLIERMEA